MKNLYKMARKSYLVLSHFYRVVLHFYSFWMAEKLGMKQDFYMLNSFFYKNMSKFAR